MITFLGIILLILIMITSYFHDLEFVDGAVNPGCRAVLDQRFPGIYSIEFLRAGRMFFGIDGGQRQVLASPCAFWHHPRHTYQYGALDARGWDHHWVLMKGPRAKRIVEQGLMPLAACGYLPVLAPTLFAEHFCELVALVRDRQPRLQARRVVLLEQMLLLLSEWTAEQALDQPWRKALEQIAARLRGTPAAPFDIRAAAGKLGLSGSHFRRLFRSYLGRAPHNYALACRIQCAVRLLQARPPRQIKAVAAEAGFKDSAQFCKTFHAHMGISPGRFRIGLPGLRIT